MKVEVLKHNSKMLKAGKAENVPEKRCDCRDSAVLSRRASSTKPRLSGETTIKSRHTGMTGDTFKVRWRGHKHDLSYRENRKPRHHRAGWLYLGPEGLQHPIFHHLGYPRQGSRLQPCHKDVQIVHIGEILHTVPSK